MSKNIERISLKKSKVVENGGPKLPTAEQLVEGELAVNYAKGYETLSIKNDSGNVVTFSSDGIINGIIAASAQTKVNTSTYTAYTAATAEVIAGKASTATTITAGDGLSGGGDLSADRTISLETTGTSGTYNTVKVDQFGRVISGSNEVKTIEISDVEGLQDALDSKASSAITITAGEGLSGGGNLSENCTIGHNTVFGSTGKTTPNADQTPSFGGTFNVPEVSYDKMGHITAVTSHTVTIPSSASTWDENYYITGAETTTATTGLSVSLTGNNNAAAASFVVSAATTDRAGLMSSSDKRLVNKFNVSGFTSAEYDSNSKKIIFGNVSGGTVAEVDATAFIKDGMVDNVEISGSNLVITFNTDAGKEPISIALSNIFDPTNYYTTGQVDTAIETATSGKADTTAMTAAISAATTGKTNQSDFTAHTGNSSIHFTTGDVQTQIDNSISGKANSDDVASAITQATSGKTNQSDFTAHTNDSSIHLTSGDVKNQIDGAIAGKADTTAVTADIEAATSGKADTSALTEHTSNSTIHFTTGTVDTMITEAVSGKANQSDFSAHTADTSIHLDSGDVQSQITNSITGKADTTAVTADINAATSGKTNQSDFTGHTADTSIHLTSGNVQSQINTSTSGYIDGADYDTTAKTINFLHGETVIDSIDASAFIKDGMVDNVEISGANLVITFNTDSGKEPISIALTSIFDPSNYYTTGQVNTAIEAATSGKTDLSAFTAHTADTSIHLTSANVQTQITNSITGKADTTAMTAAIDAATSGKMDTSAMTAYTDTVGMNAAISAATTGKTDQTAFTSHTSDATIHLTSGDVQGQIATSIAGKAEQSDFSAHTANTGIHFTTGDVQTQINNSISGKLDSSAMTAYTDTVGMNTAINAATSGKADTSALTSHTADTSVHFTTGAVQTQIANSISGKANESDLTAHTTNSAIHLTTGNVQSQIDSSISEKANSADVTTAITQATSGKADSTAVTAEISDATSGFVDSAVYDSDSKRINLKHGNTVVSYVDATAFIKDGMVENAQVSGTNLVITFNTDAGKEPISIPLTDIFNPSNYVGTGRTITTASGLTGGGNLSADKTIGLEATGTSGTYISTKTDAYGRVTSGNSTVAGSIGQGYAVSSDAGSGATKTATLADYELVVGGFVSVKFSTAVASGATLNINSNGAKSIKFMGANIPAGLIGDNVTATFVYDGTSYHLISTDAIIKAVWDNEIIYAAALNDLNARILALVDRVDALEAAV